MDRVIKIYISLILLSLSGYSFAEQDMPITSSAWKDIKIQVASIVSDRMEFYRSMGYFSDQADTYVKKSCKVEGKNAEDDSSSINNSSEIIINGNANKQIHNKQLIHILVDLNADIYLDDYSDVIIGGNINKYATIYANESTNIFVGGSIHGAVSSTSHLNLYVKGNHDGSIVSGTISSITINGDLAGSITKLAGDRSSLALKVNGYTDDAVINNIVNSEYELLKGAFHSSNIDPDVYFISYGNYYAVTEKVIK